jgi:uncharacterized protein (DUF1697 family)
MPEFVALLRGINVGKAKRIPMGDLRALFADLGYSDIATLLNSGNVVFQTAGGVATKHAKEIATAIAAHFEVDVPVIVKSAKELSAIVAENPIKAETSEHSRLLVAFTQNAKGLSDLKAIESLVVPPECFKVGKSAAYLYCARGILASQAAVALLGKTAKAGNAATSRNWATVLKLETLVRERS